MAKKDVGAIVRSKGVELRDWFQDMDAKLEDWRLTVEDTKAGMRVELHAVALLKHQGMVWAERGRARPPLLGARIPPSVRDA
jgi:hypothetical protein